MEQKNIFLLNLSPNFEKFLEDISALQIKQNDVSVLKEISNKEIWSKDDREQILSRLSILLFNIEFSPYFKCNLSNLLPELIYRVLKNATQETEIDPSSVLNVLHAYSTTKGIVLELASTYITWLSSRIHQYEKNQDVIVLFLNLIFYLCNNTEFVPNKFCSPKLLSYFQKSTNKQVKNIVDKIIRLSLKVADFDSFCENEYEIHSNEIIVEEHPGDNIEKCTFNKWRSLEEADFTGGFCSIFNVSFKIERVLRDAYKKGGCIQKKMVLTDTILKNLKTLVFGFTTNSPILISGDIGCGKTSLVEYFGQCLGRTAPPLLLKLQLGDQIESKSLLGTYVCSDTPGEFVWQPGTLTKAMQLGSWVLLEDVDQAPTDVISMLMVLAKTKKLLITGHLKEIKAVEGFQLFLTRRNTGWKNEHSILGMFIKQCHQVHMQYPTKSELIEIVKSNFEDLSQIATKLVEIFSLVSGDESLCENEVTCIIPVGRRKNTPRDLFKLCERLSSNCKNGNLSNELVFLHTLQCFCSSQNTTDFNNDMVYAVGGQLGLSKERVSYYLEKYRPDLRFDETSVAVGHTTLTKLNKHVTINRHARGFAHTRHSLCLLEKLAVCIVNSEPVLLVGDTGCGKTSAVQFLAQQCNSKLDVINMSQQTDSADLFGGYKPIDIRERVKPIKERFVQLFKDTYSQKENAKFLAHVNKCFVHKRWTILVKLMLHCCGKALNRSKGQMDELELFEVLTDKWKEMEVEVKSIESKVLSQEGLVFSFIEGALVRSLKQGNWILLDEINLATPESLEYLNGLLDFKSGSVVLSERGDIQEIERHENFRVFACMNPATDVGKKDLPYGIRNRFTEIFVGEMDDEDDLKTLVSCYLKNTTLNSTVIEGIITLYLTIRQQSKEKLVDGSGHRPLYSLRTLCRGLEYAVNQRNMPPIKAIYEGLCMSFLTQLDKPSKQMVEQLIFKYIMAPLKNAKSLGKQLHQQPNKHCVNVEGYWVNSGELPPVKDDSYVMTVSVKDNLTNLARVVAGSYPVLLQGETSVGKTSLIMFLAKLTGNKCVRVNNHEHTDIQEYIGCYGPDDNGNLVFKEGVLVTAMRYGHWMILDELNLAPSDVLEALNRVLDDNRELFIPETQEVIKAHPKFILFATQNPPGRYGGRKVLSRAFRNRFVELHLDQIPSNELEQILHQRCQLPQSYCKKFVKVMLDLQIRRRNSGIFEGKHGFMTLRDLFRWAERYHLSSCNAEQFYDWEQCMCEDGFMLIAGRCRRDDEARTIKEVLELNFKRTLNLDALFNGEGLASRGILQKVMSFPSTEDFGHIVWTDTMKRLAVLVGRALQFNEPVLLVGETGCGKTTLCQLYAKVRDSKLFSVNCHMHTEAADFLGGLRPVRNKDGQDNNRLFEWKDGPLITSMQDGQVFLIDEISLADDSVLERMNSVFEPERMLVLSEKGDSEKLAGTVDVVKAAETFCLLATMNPGGDYGKKELSPALRNRFTEIWCRPSDGKDDFKKIIEHNVKAGVQLKKFMSTNETGFGSVIIDFLEWFKNTEVGIRFTVSIRDLLSWVMFINATVSNTIDHANLPALTPEEAYIHGACLIFIDAIGSGNTAFSGKRQADVVKRECIDFLCAQVGLTDFVVCNKSYTNTMTEFGIHPFFIDKGATHCSTEVEKYNFECETTQKNIVRVLRGLQLHRPILLEGSPGVGKTSLVIALARMAAHPITRINLSEETDISDLFGADLPGEGGNAGQFLWRDGPLLRALKAGHWVVFDELNLASQSVLEGLNACLDHRAEIYIPELSKVFSVEKNTRIFACQNPLHEGGGRKGLPKSFLNRFTKVYIDSLKSEDLCQIITSIFPGQDQGVIQTMVTFNHKINTSVLDGAWGRKGGPWQFNVRDMTRWCQLIQKHQDNNAGDFIRLLYQARMRSILDQKQVIATYEEIFNDQHLECRQKTQQCAFRISRDYVKVGYSCLPRAHLTMAADHCDYELLRSQLPYMENIMKCIEMNWTALLVGSESCGKNTLVRMLSTMTGEELLTMCCNASTDSTDLIGSFEQLNKSSQLVGICKVMNGLIDAVLPKLLHCSDAILDDDVQYLMNLKEEVQRFLTDDQSQKTKETVELMSMIKNSVAKFKKSHQRLCEESSITNLEMLLKKFSETGNQGGHFEWVDGILVTALKKGNWLLLKNANLCSASILDRLNGLLEPGGVLCLDERGVIDGNIVTIKPHPNFRLFLSIDPKFGEISRAMRNRSVEIYFLSEDDGHSIDELDTKLLIRSECVHEDVANILRTVHELFKTKFENAVTWSVLLQCSKIATQLIWNGYYRKAAIYNAVVSAYGPYMKVEDSDMMLVFEELVDKSMSSSAHDQLMFSKFLPSVKDLSQKPITSWNRRNLLPLMCSNHDSDNINTLSVMLFLERSELSATHFQYLYSHLMESGGDIKTRVQKFVAYSTNKHMRESFKCDQGGDRGSVLIEMLNKTCVKLEMRCSVLRYVLLLRLFVRGMSPDLFSGGLRKGSLMFLSQQFVNRNLNLSSLPHLSISYIYTLMTSLLSELFGNWLVHVDVRTDEEFVRVVNAFEWFQEFLKEITIPLPVSLCGDVGFSLSRFAQHWKWFHEKCLSPFQERQSLGICDPMVIELNLAIGEDPKHIQFYKMVSLLCRPLTLKNSDQAELLEELRRLYKTCHTNENHVTLREQILDLTKKILFCNDNVDFSSHKKSVDQLKTDASINHVSRHISILSSNALPCFYQCLQNNLLRDSIKSLHRSSPVNLSPRTCAIFVEGTQSTSLDFLLSVSILGECGQYVSNVERVIPLLMDSLYSSRFPDVNSIVFSAESAGECEEKKLDNVMIPLSLPLFVMAKQISKREEDELTCLHVALDEMEGCKEELEQLLSFVWDTEIDLFSSVQFYANMGIESCERLIRLLQVYVTVMERFDLLERLNTLESVAADSLELNRRRQLSELLTLSKNDLNVSSNLVKLFEEIGQLLNSDSALTEPVCGAMLSFYTSLVDFELTKPYLKYDPVEEMTSRKSRLEQQLSNIEQELLFRYKAENMWAGVPVLQINGESIRYEHLTSNAFAIRVLMRRREIITSEINTIQHEQVVRPQSSEYDMLYQEFRYFQETVGNLDNMVELMKNVERVIKREDSDTNEMKSLRHKVDAWVNSTSQFVSKLKRYTFYQDVTMPPLIALKSCQNSLLVVSGMMNDQIQSRLFSSYLQLSRNDILHPRSLLSKLCVVMVEFPIRTVNNFLDPKMMRCSEYISKRYPEELFNLLPSVLTLCLVSLYRHFSISGTSIQAFAEKKSFSFSLLNQILMKFYALWCSKIEHDHQQEVENAALFKYKSRTHCESEPVEELERMEKSLFPCYADVFEEEKMTSTNSVEQPNIAATSNVPVIDDVAIFNVVKSIYLDDHEMCYDVHRVLSRSFELVTRLSTVGDLVQFFPKDESNFPLVLLILSKLVKGMSLGEPINPEVFNIYEDSNIREAIESKNTLQKLRCSVAGLLKVYEDHPALIQIMNLVDRLLSFSACVPLMKLVTGFELLLKQSQDWESYAASHVSLKQHLEQVTEQVIQWRRLELKTWSSLLKRTEEKHHESVSKWFFHFVNLLQEVTGKDDPKEGEYVSALKEFLENANIGDFSARLLLVETLHAYIKSNEGGGQLQNVTLNILLYYKQFQSSIEKFKEDGKKPLQKDLLNYIKIAKWNDNNFYSIKLAAEKSHRTLTKLVQKFQLHLKEPITQFLQDTKLVAKPISSIAKTFQYTRLPNLRGNQEHQNVYQLAKECPDFYLSQPIALARRMRNHIDKIMLDMRYGHFVEGIDVFIGDVIEGMNGLRNQTLDGVPKEKQKEARNNMQQMKRKSLSSLLKQLKEIGLSSFKGDVLLDEAKVLRLPTLVSAKCLSSEVDDILKTCNYYYFQSIARHAVFQHAICNACKEIGPNTINHFKGFTSHLHRVACQQRTMLGPILRAHSDIKLFLSGLVAIESNVKPTKTPLPPQEMTKHWLLQTHELLAESFSTLNFVKEVFLCAPSLNNNSVVENMNGTTTERPENNKSEEITSLIASIQKSTNHIKVTCNEPIIREFREWEFSIVNWGHWEFVELCVNRLKDVMKLVDHVINFCSSRRNNLLCPDKSPIITPLVELRRKLAEFLGMFSMVTFEGEDIQGDLKHDVNVFEDLIKKILLSIQKISKVEDILSIAPSEEEREDYLLKGQLSPLLTKTYETHLSLLNIDKISALCTTCMVNIQRADNKDSSMYLNMIPVLREYVALSEFYIFHTVMLHRTTCKMLSVLYELFTTLLKEGYCKPPEESSTSNEENATEFEDIKDGGLGEGSGAKDVSDQIESEDQVEDTHHEKQQQDEQKNEEEDEHIKQEKEGIEMTDDFEAALDDMELGDDDKDSNDGDEDESQEDDDNDEPEKQMGDVDDEQNELDKNMWDEQEEEQEEDEKSKNEDKTDDDGKGEVKDWKSEEGFAAKEDELDSQEAKQESEQEPPPKQQEESSTEDNDDDGTDEKHEAEENGVGDKEEDNKNHEDEAGFDEKLQLDDMSGDDDDDEELDEKPDEADEEDVNDQNDMANELDNNETEEIDDENCDDENTLLETKPMKEPLTNEQIESNNQSGGGHQNSANEDRRQKDAGSSDQTENIDDDQTQEGHYTQVVDAQSTKQKGKKRKEFQKSNNERTLETNENEKDVKKRRPCEAASQDEKESTENDQPNDSETYQHIESEDAPYDELSVDVISKEQLKQMDHVPGVSMSRHDNNDVTDSEDEEMMDTTDVGDFDAKTTESQAGLAGTSEDQIVPDEALESENEMDVDHNEEEKNESSDERKSDYFTNNQQLISHNYNLKDRDAFIECLRKELEEDLIDLPCGKSPAKESFDYIGMWMKYDQLTNSLSTQLCEQLRLVIEPTQASKLKGDYRTGKRLNMRKIIPYIASQFQKDKIWLRRTKKSKRNYQIVLAVDDSSSMMDNHLKQLAFESIVVISNGLKLLEAGDLAVISFGEDSHLVHSFEENFNEQVGASILQKFTFEQTKTRVAHLLKYCMLLFERNRRSTSVNTALSQLLLIVSDGRGIFLEGKETVTRAVSQAREMGIFIVFIILDDPKSANSILDIKVPVFKSGGGMPEIKSYIEEFPFPFYLLLRDINSLPHVLSDALKQWFELVTQPT